MNKNFYQTEENFFYHQKELMLLNIAENENYKVAILDDGLQDYSTKPRFKLCLL